MRPGGGKLRPLGFFLLMLGFGLRLDSDWQRLAWILLAGGGVVGVTGLVALLREPPATAAFVEPGGKG